jgi:hypothetical protein
MFSSGRQPPPGWNAEMGTLTPSETVGGYLARHQELRGACYSKDCRRRCEVELKALFARGFGRLTRRELLHLYRCNRLDGCNLDLIPDPVQALLPLRDLAGVPGIATRIRCTSCQFFRRYTVEEMIGQLEAAKKGGGRTGVQEVAALFTAPCKQCKKKSWTFEVLWPSEETQSWRNGARP